MRRDGEEVEAALEDDEMIRSVRRMLAMAALVLFPIAAFGRDTETGGDAVDVPPRVVPASDIELVRDAKGEVVGLAISCIGTKSGYDPKRFPAAMRKKYVNGCRPK